MANLSLNLPVFIASPSDVMPERQAADDEIVATIREVTKRRLVLEPFNWVKDHLPTPLAPQPPIEVHLRRAELVVFILWGRIGPGTKRELDVALDQARRGETDSVMIYFKKAPPPSSADAKTDKLNANAVRA